MSGAGGPVVLVPSLLVGAAALALWVEVRITGRTARTARVIFVHLAAAFGLLTVAPWLLELVYTGGQGARGAAMLLLLILPALVYAFLAALWTLGYLRNALDGARG